MSKPKQDTFTLTWGGEYVATLTFDEAKDWIITHAMSVNKYGHYKFAGDSTAKVKVLQDALELVASPSYPQKKSLTPNQKHNAFLAVSIYFFGTFIGTVIGVLLPLNTWELAIYAIVVGGAWGWVWSKYILDAVLRHK